MHLSRRKLLHLGLFAAPAPILLIACGGDEAVPDTGAGASSPAAGARVTSTPSAAASSATRTTGSTSTGSPALSPTPACGDDDDPTPAQTEGPYFTPNSPERVSLRESGLRGAILVIEGQVLTQSCQPVGRALVDFWQCDDAGVYDNTGFRLRGHQFTDDSGRYRLESIVPGIYTGRTRHIHVKVQAPNRPVLTTQLYFPNEPQNARDGIYAKDLELANYRDASGGKAGAYTFVLNLT